MSDLNSAMSRHLSWTHVSIAEVRAITTICDHVISTGQILTCIFFFRIKRIVPSQTNYTLPYLIAYKAYIHQLLSSTNVLARAMFLIIYLLHPSAFHMLLDWEAGGNVTNTSKRLRMYRKTVLSSAIKLSLLLLGISYLVSLSDGRYPGVQQVSADTTSSTTRSKTPEEQERWKIFNTLLFAPVLIHCFLPSSYSPQLPVPSSCLVDLPSWEL